MCPACVSTLALIVAGAGSAAGLGAVIAKTVRTKPAGQAPTKRAPAVSPVYEEEVQ